MLQESRNQISSYFKLPNPNLMAYLGTVRAGRMRVVESPFAESETVSELLAAWDNQLDAINKKYPGLYQFEQDMRSKVGPLSYQLPLCKRYESIDKYYTDVQQPAKEMNTTAVKAVISEWKRSKGLNPRSLDQTIKRMKLSTNSGNPYFMKRRDAISEMHTGELLKVNDKTIQVIDQTAWNTCAVLGWRGQEGGPSIKDVKQRVVWMFPLLINIIELSVYQVLIETAQRFNYLPAYVSMDAVDTCITKLMDSKGRNDLIMCTDFTSFDTHFNAALQTASKHIIEATFTRSELMDKWMEVVYPIKYNIDLLCDPNTILTGSHGMGSGSGGTNLDESLAHRALQYEAAMSQRERLNIYSTCLGDDGILSYPHLNPDKVIESYTSHGLEMNPDKQDVSPDECIYLRRWHHYNYRVDGRCVGVYSTMRALGRLRYQERYYDKWSAKMVALRQLSILENIKFHPMRDQFVKFCMKRDRYKLGIDIPGFLDNVKSEAEEATAYMPDFLGYTKTQQLDQGGSIADWWIVKYLKSLT